MLPGRSFQNGWKTGGSVIKFTYVWRLEDPGIVHSINDTRGNSILPTLRLAHVARQQGSSHERIGDQKCCLPKIVDGKQPGIAMIDKADDEQQDQSNTKLNPVLVNCEMSAHFSCFLDPMLAERIVPNTGEPCSGSRRWCTELPLWCLGANRYYRSNKHKSHFRWGLRSRAVHCKVPDPFIQELCKIIRL